MERARWPHSLLLLPILAASLAAAQPQTPPGDLPPEEIEPGEAPPAGEYFLEPGYRLELVVEGLSFPTSVAFHEGNGTVYVAEAGYSYGPAIAIPRVYEVTGLGERRLLTTLPDGPITGLSFHNGSLYAIGGRVPAEVWRIDPRTGANETVLTGFPVWGHHFTSDIVFGPDGKMYFAVGYPSNSGVVGLDDYFIFGWLPFWPEGHDIPCDGLRLVLLGRNYVTDNPLTPEPDDKAVTSAFHPFNVSVDAGSVVGTNPPPDCNGAVFRADADGSNLEVYAQGFRNLYGFGFSPNGTLYGINQGMDNGGSRAVYRDWDALWDVRKGMWGGFPDWASGIYITDEHFDPPHKPAPEPVLAEHPDPPGEPFFRFDPNTGTHHFDFSRDPAFGHVEELFAAQYGSQMVSPIQGHKVVRLNMTTREVSDFYVNHVPGVNGSAPERPTAARFHPLEPALYVVDFGELNTDGGVFVPSAETGALWRIMPGNATLEGVGPTPTTPGATGPPDAGSGAGESVDPGDPSASIPGPAPLLVAAGVAIAARALARGRR